MENDEYNKKLNDFDNNSPSLINVFKPDYKNQNFENSNEFQKWKKTMINKYGEKGKFYQCSYDNIVFYSLYSDNQKDEIGFCTICHNGICYFCKKKLVREYGNCCLKQIFNYMHKDGIRFLNSDKGKINKLHKKAFIFFLIPCLNFIIFINLVYNVFYYKLAFSNEKDRQYLFRYMDIFLERDKETLFAINVAINFFTCILLLIPFLFYNIAFSFILLILSICPKSPYSYFIGAIKILFIC